MQTDNSPGATAARDVLTPQALMMLQVIGQSGSFATAARALGLVPSALTYRVRQIEDALDVLLFDRSSRQAQLTEAGAELLREATRLLNEMDAVANRVKRVATGWEPHLTIALDTVISKATMLELCEKFLALNPPTRLKLRDEALSGTLQTLTSGQSDLAIGVPGDSTTHAGVQSRLLGHLKLVFVVAPHHPLANAPEPIRDDIIKQHRAVAVADTNPQGNGMTYGLLSGQPVLTVATMPDKLDAQVRGLGAGFVPEYLARPAIAAGRLLLKRVDRAERLVRINYAWRGTHKANYGKALQWWLEQLESPTTRVALLER
jgi:DNA-binding transcriptional LysR family regulator